MESTSPGETTLLCSTDPNSGRTSILDVRSVQVPLRTLSARTKEEVRKKKEKECKLEHLG